jgi:hypothetical protein
MYSLELDIKLQSVPPMEDFGNGISVTRALLDGKVWEYPVGTGYHLQVTAIPDQLLMSRTGRSRWDTP